VPCRPDVPGRPERPERPVPLPVELAAAVVDGAPARSPASPVSVALPAPDPTPPELDERGREAAGELGCDRECFPLPDPERDGGALWWPVLAGGFCTGFGVGDVVVGAGGVTATVVVVIGADTGASVALGLVGEPVLQAPEPHRPVDPVDPLPPEPDGVTGPLPRCPPLGVDACPLALASEAPKAGPAPPTAPSARIEHTTAITAARSRRIPARVCGRVRMPTKRSSGFAPGHPNNAC
jgi:hypothetical protein